MAEGDIEQDTGDQIAPVVRRIPPGTQKMGHASLPGIVKMEAEGMPRPIKDCGYHRPEQRETLDDVRKRDNRSTHLTHLTVNRSMPAGKGFPKQMPDRPSPDGL